MRMFFWDYDDYNDIAREWTMFVINLLAVLFTANALISTIRYHGKFIFELVPLSVNFLATSILMLLKLFEKGYQFDQIGYIVEIFTYFLFCYTFALMFAKVTRTKKAKLIKRVFNCLLLLFILAFIVTSSLVFTGVISKSCDRNIFAPAFASFVSELISFIPTVFYGSKIVTHLLETQKKYLVETVTTENDINVLSSSSDEYIRQRKRQVLIVLFAYSLSLIMRALLLFMTEQFANVFDCDYIEGVYIITSDVAIGQIILVVIELNQLLPHVMIPYALYIIPVHQKTRTKSISLEDPLLEEQEGSDDESTRDQVIKKRLSTMILSKTSQSVSDSLSEDPFSSIKYTPKRNPS